jgi:hypothetical protein
VQDSAKVPAWGRRRDRLQTKDGNWSVSNRLPIKLPATFRPIDNAEENMAWVQKALSALVIFGTKKKGSGSQALSQPLIGLGVACPTLPRISFQHHGEDVDSADQPGQLELLISSSRPLRIPTRKTCSFAAALRKGIPARSCQIPDALTIPAIGSYSPSGGHWYLPLILSLHSSLLVRSQHDRSSIMILVTKWAPTTQRSKKIQS